MARGESPGPGIEIVCIVGAGPAGAAAAASLREIGFDGDVILIGAQRSLPHDPDAFWQVVQGDVAPERAVLYDEGFYDAQGIQLLLESPVTLLDPAQRRLVVDGDDLAYDWLILATGTRPVTLDVPGARLPGVESLATVDDAQRLRRLLEAKPRVVVVGGGLIGTQAAAAARDFGADVTVLHGEDVPLQDILGRDVATAWMRRHTEQGVQVRRGVRAEEFMGDDAVEAVRTSEGDVVAADVVLVDVGLEPNDDLARSAGLDVDGGIVTNEYLQTSDQLVYAAGEAANAWHPLYERRVRVHQWPGVAEQANAAAKTIAGAPTAYDLPPRLALVQYGARLEFVGDATGYDELVVRGDTASAFSAFYLSGGRVLAAAAVDHAEDVPAAAALIRGRATPDRERLADPGVPLESLTERS